MPDADGYDIYTEVPLDAASGATVISYHERAHGWSLAVNHGIVDGLDRAKRAHRLHVEGHAAEAAIRRQDGAIQAWLRARGGRSDVLDFGPRRKGRERVEAEILHLAGLVAGRDPYQAARAIEDEYNVDGDQSLYEAVARAVGLMRDEAATPEGRLEGARRLGAATPGPTTALARTVARLHGRPGPDGGPVAIPAPEGSVAVCLGTALVAPAARAGRGGFTGRVEVTATVTFDPASIEFDRSGGIAYAGVTLAVLHDPALWHPDRDGMLYGDVRTQEAVNGLLAAAGLSARAEWSERGRQSAKAGDMDVDCAIVAELWPAIVAERREAAGPEPTQESLPGV